jgi:hypothetical protein
MALPPAIVDAIQQLYVAKCAVQDAWVKLAAAVAAEFASMPTVEERKEILIACYVQSFSEEDNRIYSLSLQQFKEAYEGDEVAKKRRAQLQRNVSRFWSKLVERCLSLIHI